ncbi:hypothetical protein [Stenomitos frigidus]|uniref:DUF11 domain-containing protein n=1 Tax=Stenomitos frigidus ULC18 TaxID=2107698 RepID=A0A2T1DWN6_9CYAN|nr:hypothetical protein [Stenomitos frigidus]PSB24794.1 hypothetical protein C7B82_25655 [Stenomitos frigidus ULC18]
MKRQFALGLSVAAVILTIPFASKLPVVAGLFNSDVAIAKAMQHPKVQLNLMGEKQVISKDAQGKEIISWQGGQLAAQPGDVLRYRLMGKNEGDRPIKNLTLNQSIPKGTVFVLKSAKATSSQAARMTYSIDTGRSFVEAPTVQVTLPNGKVETRPAPAEAYTHIRWNLPNMLAAKAPVNAEYQVKVR